MMCKNLFPIGFCALALACVLSVSCSKDTGASSVSSNVSVSLSYSSLTVPYGGDDCFVFYLIINGEDDGTVSCSTDAGWIIGLDCSIDNYVGFTVTANYGVSARTGTVTVSYSDSAGGSASASLTVVQECGGESVAVSEILASYIGVYLASARIYDIVYDDDGNPIPDGDSYLSEWVDTTWTLEIYSDPADSSFVWIGGYTPYVEGAYGAFYSTSYSVPAYADETTGYLLVPNYVCGGTVTYDKTYHVGFLVCDDEYVYFGKEVYNTFSPQSDGTLKSRYYVSCNFLNTDDLDEITDENFDSLYEGYVDYVSPVTLTKLDSSASSLSPACDSGTGNSGSGGFAPSAVLPRPLGKSSPVFK